MGHDPDADAVELLQVGLIDHQELEALQQRHRRICRLEQYALVKGEPAQLPVDVDALGGGFPLFLNQLFRGGLPRFFRLRFSLGR